jgi:CheY-like chemotaxis protein
MKLSTTQSVLLADDDADDCALFEEALLEIALPIQLTTVHDGEQLMNLLKRDTGSLPSVLFLDLNMPRKNGFECLSEIKKDKNLSNLNVIILSTSYQPEVANLLYKNGAHHYIRKPSDFNDLKRLIHQALTKLADHHTKETFVLG